MILLMLIAVDLDEFESTRDSGQMYLYLIFILSCNLLFLLATIMLQKYQGRLDREFFVCNFKSPLKNKPNFSFVKFQANESSIAVETEFNMG